MGGRYSQVWMRSLLDFRIREGFGEFQWASTQLLSPSWGMRLRHGLKVEALEKCVCWEYMVLENTRKTCQYMKTGVCG